LKKRKNKTENNGLKFKQNVDYKEIF